MRTSARVTIDLLFTLSEAPIDLQHAYNLLSNFEKQITRAREQDAKTCSTTSATNARRRRRRCIRIASAVNECARASSASTRTPGCSPSNRRSCRRKLNAASKAARSQLQKIARSRILTRRVCFLALTWRSMRSTQVCMRHFEKRRKNMQILVCSVRKQLRQWREFWRCRAVSRCVEKLRQRSQRARGSLQQRQHQQQQQRG